MAVYLIDKVMSRSSANGESSVSGQRSQGASKIRVNTIPRKGTTCYSRMSKLMNLEEQNQALSQAPIPASDNTLYGEKGKPRPPCYRHQTLMARSPLHTRSGRYTLIGFPQMRGEVMTIVSRGGNRARKSTRV